MACSGRAIIPECIDLAVNATSNSDIVRRIEQDITNMAGETIKGKAGGIEYTRSFAGGRMTSDGKHFIMGTEWVSFYDNPPLGFVGPEDVIELSSHSIENGEKVWYYFTNVGFRTFGDSLQTGEYAIRDLDAHRGGPYLPELGNYHYNGFESAAPNRVLENPTAVSRDLRKQCRALNRRAMGLPHG